MDYKKIKKCIKVADKIIDKYGSDTDIDLYPQEEQIVAIIITGSGIIENGGFEYLFATELPGTYIYRKILNAFVCIGASRAVNAIQNIYALFPDNNPDREMNERKRIYYEASQKYRDECDQKYYKAREETYECLEKYIKDKKIDKKYRWLS